MDVQSLGIAASGVFVGWWLTRGESPKEVGPCQCHCSCSLPEVAAARDYSGGIWWLVGTLLFGLLGTFIILVVVIQLKRIPDPKEFTFGGFKGGVGKGKYGAERGLQILDRWYDKSHPSSAPMLC